MAGQQYSHEDYTVGWVCALPKTELVAAAAMLDEEHPVLRAADTQDANSYLLGRIGNHNVVIACLPAETTGKVSAARVATDMIRSFPSIRFGLMVGIAGGVPCRACPDQGTADEVSEDDFDEWDDKIEEVSDIRLGDVVVSLHTKSAEAVVQYDFGKSLQEKEFVRTGGKLNKPPHIILNAVAQLQANHIRGRRKIPELLSKMLIENPDMIRFQHPGWDKDRLFRSDAVHMEGRKSCRDCCGHNNANLVKRKGRTGTAPNIHYGTIGSADQVMKDAILRDRWALKENILCFEMEAAGLMDSFPCLVIRGICDYADSHKNNVWQPYAAATAAAYAKELLLVIPGQGLTELSPIEQLLRLPEEMAAIKSTLDRTLHQGESHHHDQLTRYQTEDRRRCHQALKTSTYERFKNINPNRMNGTCEWVFKSPKYLRWWHATSNDLLWITADPGCGKSVLAKALVDENFPVSDTNDCIIYFFFKDNDEQNDLATALCAVLHQLFSLQPQLLQYALPFWERNHKKIQYETDDLWRILMAASWDPSFTNTICVFDALDECRDQDQKQLIGKLREFHVQCPATHKKWLKFFVTSRPYDNIQDHFWPVTKIFPQIHLRGEEDDNQIREEINLVVRSRVAELGENLGLSASTQKRLEKELSGMKNRTYLWLYLVIDNIEGMLRNSLRPDCETIPPLPKDVAEAYENILDRVPSNQKAMVDTILRIIVGARRPLSIKEMAMALGVATCRNADTTTEAGLNPNGLDKKLRRLCGLFIFIDDSKIYLIHQTARDFLLGIGDRSASSRWYLEPSRTELFMSEICIRYLLMNDLVSKDEESRLSLLQYSSENWADHFREVIFPVHELVQCVLKLYDVTTDRFNLWFPRFWKAAMPSYKDPKMEALHLAAFNGHESMLSCLAVNAADTVDCFDGSRTNALQWACLRGFEGTVQQLLEMGADVNAQGGYYGNALQAASRNGHLEIVQGLLERGADVEAHGGGYETDLEAASRNGYLKIIERHLESNTNTNREDGLYNNALQAASGNGYVEIVQKLIKEGADVNSTGGEYGSALQAASRNGHVEIVHQLLNMGADVNAQSGFFGNALQAASRDGNVEIVQQLLEVGADINAQGGYYGNALQAASQNGHNEVVQKLLENGAAYRARGGNDSIVLQRASESGQPVDNTRGGNFSNDFPGPSGNESFSVFKQLLEKGIDVIVQAGYHGNALQAASRNGHFEIVQHLIDKGANVNAQGGFYGNALQAASRNGHFEIVQHLIDKGANVNAQGGFYGDALQAASRNGHHEIIQYLIDKGANVNALGGFYGNALQAASGGGYIQIVQQLLERGADINAQGGEYNSALQAASQNGHTETVQQLIKMGANINSQGGEYRSILEVASGTGYGEICQPARKKRAIYEPFPHADVLGHQYLCFLCPMPRHVNRRGALKRHVRETHWSKSVFLCTYCGWSGIRKDKFRSHLQVIHLIDISQMPGDLLNKELMLPLPSRCVLCTSHESVVHKPPFQSWESWFEGIEMHCHIGDDDKPKLITGSNLSS